MNAKLATAVGLLFLAAVLGLTCAPGNLPSSKTSAGAGTEAVSENLPIMPTLAAAEPGSRVKATIEHVARRQMQTDNGFWTVFHGILGLGPSVTLQDPDTKKRVNALQFICDGGQLRGLQFNQTKYGLDVVTGAQAFVGQGHQDQFIAEMAQWGIPADTKFVVFGRDYTYMDFVHHSKMRARTTEKQELSWAIVILGQYLGTDIAWTNDHGEKLRYEDLVRYELDADVFNAACGGTHRLFGLDWAYLLHLKKGGKTEGVWQEIAAKTAKFRNLAKQYQNADGAFSTEFFRGPGNAENKELRINSSGHILEWLSLALSDEEIKEGWVEDAANAVAKLILDLQGAGIESGTLYHATHGLILYYARRYDADALGENKPYMPRPGLNGPWGQLASKTVK